MSIERVIATKPPSAYDADLFQWLTEQQRLLRSGDLSALDLPNLAEEIDDLGKNLKREVSSRLETLIVHLIKLSVSVASNPKAGWKATVREQRRQLEKIFEDSPSLRRYARETYPRALSNAKSDAYLALTDYEPEKSEEYMAKIESSWDVVDIDIVLEDGQFVEIAKLGTDRPDS